MDRAVTWSSLFGVGFIVAGISLILFGGLALFAGAESDSPDAGVRASSQGWRIGAVGLASLAAGIWMVR